MSGRGCLYKNAQVYWGNFGLKNIDFGIDTSGRLAPSDSQHWEKIEDLKGLCVLPGVIDTQVHFREPGKTYKEDIESGSRAALLGGVTGFFDMPNTDPPTITRESLLEKLNIAEKSSYVDFAFYAGASAKELDLNILELKKMRELPGCCGIKIFMGSSTGALLVHDDASLEKIISSLPGPFAIHAEDEQRLIDRKAMIDFSQGALAHELWRDEMVAYLATQRVLTLARKYQKWVHILHVTTQEEIEFLADHKDLVTVEVTPQHLTLESPDCYERLGTKAQMNPPIRGKRHREALLKALKNGVVDIIGSDHAPHTLEEKSKALPHSPAGMPGVQTLLPIMLNHLHQGHLSLDQLVSFLSLNPAKHFRLIDRGPLEWGKAANLTIVDLKKQVRLEDQMMASKVGWTPFAGMVVKGYPTGVLLRGNWALKEGQIMEKVGAMALKSI